MNRRPRKPTHAQKLKEEQRLVARAITDTREIVEEALKRIQASGPGSTPDVLQDIWAQIDNIETEVGILFAHMEDLTVAVGRLCAQRAEAYRQRDRAVRYLKTQNQQNQQKKLL